MHPSFSMSQKHLTNQATRHFVDVAPKTQAKQKKEKGQRSLSALFLPVGNDYSLISYRSRPALPDART